ncbi:uncharacterized protein [Manis javanica]|uniref:uncharacterized protein isoform X1 n=1 Tax=Manis javanica TaxID=9974 RepID=UPI003C6DB39D
MDPGSGNGGGGGSSRGSRLSARLLGTGGHGSPRVGPVRRRRRPLAAVAAEAQREHHSAAFSRQLHVSAKPFVPNVHAAEFVPSFLRGPAQPSPVPTTTEPAVAREALLHLWNLLKRNNHVKVQIQLLAWKFQNLLKMGRQKCLQKNHGSTKKESVKQSQWVAAWEVAGPRGKCPGDDGGGRGDTKTQICGCTTRCS